MGGLETFYLFTTQKYLLKQISLLPYGRLPFDFYSVGGWRYCTVMFFECVFWKNLNF